MLFLAKIVVLIVLNELFGHLVELDTVLSSELNSESEILTSKNEIASAKQQFSFGGVLSV